MTSNRSEEEEKEEFKKYYEKYSQKGGFVMSFLHEENNEKILICFMNSKKAVIEDDITIILKKINEMKMKRGILVSSSKLTGSGEKIIKYINSSTDIYLQFFMIKDLLINITHHELVPKHVKCSLKEKEIVMKKYRVKESQLPKILMSDPMAKYLGLKKGDLVKIIRKSETAGLYVVYRIVI